MYRIIHNAKTYYQQVNYNIAQKNRRILLFKKDNQSQG
jgi:hypothetical protein